MGLDAQAARELAMMQPKGEKVRVRVFKTVGLRKPQAPSASDASSRGEFETL
jgi:hypothetical protein